MLLAGVGAFSSLAFSAATVSEHSRELRDRALEGAGQLLHERLVICIGLDHEAARDSPVAL